MKKQFMTIFLTLSMCPGLAVPAFAAPVTEILPDWYFLFAVFKNVDADYDDGTGTIRHTRYAMAQEEVNLARENARQFEEFLNQFGLMRAHVEVVEIETPVMELQESDEGPYFDAIQAVPLLREKVDLDRYDHVFSVVSLDIDTKYTAMTGSMFENGTGHSCVNLRVARRYFIPAFPESAYVHEFLHIMERLNTKWGMGFDLHGIQEKIYAPSKDEWKVCYTDIILNRAKGDAEIGTGVYPASWQYPPRVLRTMREFEVPDGITEIGDSAFQYLVSLEEITIPSGVTRIGNWAFAYCGSLHSILIPGGVTSIGEVAFYMCRSLSSVSIPASVTSIGGFAFSRCDNLSDVYYAGTEEQWSHISIGDINSSLTDATIHYNSAGPAVTFTDVPAGQWYSAPVDWAVSRGITNGTEKGKFSPAQTCTHMQILTFLSRAAGKTSTAMPWDEEQKQVQNWARETGMIGSGFNGGKECTRADAVNYIWQALGREDAKAGSFTDVNPNAGYAKAVDWAVANGVTNGTNKAQTEFSPNKVCDRGTIVTFLHRAYVPSARLSV